MPPSNVLPQTGGATQPAPSTQSTPDAPTIMDDPVEKEQIQTYRATNRRNLRLYFSEVGAQMHGPLFVVSDQRVEQICAVSDGDTLIVVLVPADPDFEGSAEQCF